MQPSNRVMVFIDWFYPAFKGGGPIKSVHNIVTTLKEEIDFLIVTSDHDVDGTKLNIESNQLIEKDGFQVIYLPKEEQSITRYRQLQELFKPTHIYYNSLFSFYFTLLPYRLFRAASVKQIIAPRGMLGKGALSIKPLKKRLFLLMSKYFFFRKDTLWHASTEQEATEIRTHFGKTAKLIIAQNISNTPQARKTEDNFKRERHLKLLFYSRISSKKNLLFLIELFDKLRELENLSLDIFGPLEDKRYWEKCELQLQKDKRINYKGLIQPDKLVEVLHRYHYSVLPTLHENFGHTIAESISAGLPVIISDNTPWKELEKEQVGYELSLSDSKEWKELLQDLYLEEDVSYKKRVEACLLYSRRNIVSSEVVNQNKKLFGIAE
jgi:glycosyltransferase involved in cell wall biosynthesis